MQLRHEGATVVLSFPYRADLVQAVRAIPGRRFDWDAKEWSAPTDDWAGAMLTTIIERFPELTVSDDVLAWLSAVGKRWVGRVTAAKQRGQGFFVCESRGGDLPDELAARATRRGTSEWIAFDAEVAQTLLDLPAARLDARALSCAQRLVVGLDPPPAVLAHAEGVGGPAFRLDVLWDPDAGAAFDELPSVDTRNRTVPVDPFIVEPLDRYLKAHGVEVGSSARPVLAALREEALAARGRIEGSQAIDGPPLDPLPSLGGELAPFQHAGTRYLLETRRAFLADEQGLGKTVQALAALEADGAFPAIVVCPASLKLNWEREAAKWLPQRTRVVVSGRGRVPEAADLTILNYEIVEAHHEALALRRPRALVLDESHLVKNPRAQRTKAARRLADALPRDGLRLALTGTPVMNHPDELIAQLRVLGRLEEFGSGARFSRRFRGAGFEERLHWHLRRHCFVRRLKSEVLPQLPAKRRTVVPVALTNEQEYRLAERDVIAWLKSQPLDLKELDAKVAAALRAERLAQLNTLKQLAARGKLAAALGWIEDFLASEERLVVFAHHAKIQEALVARFPDAAHLLGRDTQLARDAAVRAFQSDDGPQLIVCSTAVGSQGITLTQASNVCFLELEWTPAMHDQAEDRCHRIGQHDAVTAWYLLADGTIDETIARLIERKRAVVAAVTDGRERADEPITEAVARELRNAPIRHLRAAG